jgi:(p)ppGpp synthase/HD superfamily hydrolase
MSDPPLNPPTERFVRAVGRACEWHTGQARKHTTVPYVSHLLGVASLVMEHGGTEDQCIAGLLHDAVEDTGGLARADDIRREFGDVVADIVLGCSDSTDPDHKAPWRQRKEAYLAHLELCSNQVLLVSLCDKLHNARAIAVDDASPGDKLWDRFNASKDDIGWYYRSLLKSFKNSSDGEDAADAADVPPLPAALLREFEQTIARIWI